MRQHFIYQMISVVSAASLLLGACSNPFNPEIAKGSNLYPKENAFSTKVVHVEVTSDFLEHVQVATAYGADPHIPGCSRWTGDGGYQALSVIITERLQKIGQNRAAVDIHLDKFVPGHCNWRGGLIQAAPYVGEPGGYSNPIIYVQTPYARYDGSFKPPNPPQTLNYIWNCSPIGHPCDGAFVEYPSQIWLTVPNAWPAQGRAYLFIRAIRLDSVKRL